MLRQMRIKKREASPDERAIIGGQPDQDDAMGLCVQAWHDLHSERPIGMGGAGLIPFTSVLTWAQFHCLDRDVTTILITVLRKLDHDRAEREASKANLR